MGDFNGDGHPDVAVGFETVFSVFLNAAPATRQPTTNSIQTAYNGCGSLTVTTNVSSHGGPVPTGTLTFQVDGEYFTPQFGSLDASGNASTSILLTPGNHTIASVYSGDSFMQASSASVVVNVQPQPSQTSLTSNLNPSTVGQAVTLTAAVVSSDEIAWLSGNITFLDGTTVLVTVLLGSTPSNPIPTQFSLATSDLNVGNHAITASYGGETFISPSISAAVVQVVNGTNLSLGVAAGSSSSATVTAGATANYMLSIGGSGFSGTVTLSCTGAPAGASCSVPAPLSVSATQPSQFTVKVSTTPRTTSATFPNNFNPVSAVALALTQLIQVEAFDGVAKSTSTQ